MRNHNEFGKLLRHWREDRRLSQLALASNAEISTKHLSFLETGRAAPSREMIVRLAEELRIPLRQRNALLDAAGYADLYPERPLGAPGLQLVDEVVRTVLTGHEPYPAMAIDCCWNIVAMNRAIETLIRSVSRTLLEQPLNAMRLVLHPDGLAPAILNFSAWRTHAFGIIKHRAEATDDPRLVALLNEVQGYQYCHSRMIEPVVAKEAFAIPLQLATPRGDISLVTTSMVFGSPRDVTVSELAIECLFPTDDASASILRSLAENS